MRRLMADAPGAVSGRFARQAGLLLLLAAALAGFFLLLNLLSSRVSTGPEDILAVNPSEEDEIGLPSGIGLFTFSVVAVSVILGIAALLAPQRWPLRLNGIRSSLPLVAGALVAVTLIGTGTYLAFSGILGQEISYEQYLVERSRLQPIGLAVLAGFFLSVSIVGILTPRLLLLMLLFWLLAAIIFGLVNSLPSDEPQFLGGTETGDGNGAGESGGHGGGLGDVGGPRAPISDLEDREKALLELERAGAYVDWLENGSALVSQDGVSHLFAGTTTRQATESSPTLVFEVTGAAHTGYLRTSVGDVYEGGRWRQLDPVTVPYAGAGTISDSVRDQYASTTSGFAELPDWRRDTALLFGLSDSPIAIDTDRIEVRTTGSLKELSPGPVPTSLSLVDTPLRGDFRPFSATFSTKNPVTSYSWTSNVVSYSDAQYSATIPSSDPTYTQLPAGLPDRIRRLALDVTEGHTTPYAKAKALERHLKAQYTYRFASSTGAGQPPPGHDPADWFLFDHREGTCGMFSTAFVVLARSIGIPTRVVSGWVVIPAVETQIVRSDQAHQWAEVAFERIGWVRFEPTPAGGAPSRLSGADDPQGQEAHSEPMPADRMDTVTTITQWPPEMRRQTTFTVGGTVSTVAGDPVSGMTVEVYVNETKAQGGIKIGATETRLGNFQAEVQMPAALKLGAFQLLARAAPNDGFNESWSDPDITVVSSSGFEITGPSEVPVDVGATFRGRLSEDTGEGADDREVKVTIDGSPAPPVITGPAGRFSFTKSFSEPGPHWVEVAVAGRGLPAGQLGPAGLQGNHANGDHRFRPRTGGSGERVPGDWRTTGHPR